MRTAKPTRYVIKVNRPAANNRAAFSLIDKKRDMTIGTYPTLINALNALDFMRRGGLRFGNFS
jgi:hypothetical protein